MRFLTWKPKLGLESLPYAKNRSNSLIHFIFEFQMRLSSFIWVSQLSSSVHTMRFRKYCASTIDVRRPWNSHRSYDFLIYIENVNLYPDVMVQTYIRNHEVNVWPVNSERVSKILEFWSSCVIDSEVICQKLQLNNTFRTYIQRNWIDL